MILTTKITALRMAPDSHALRELLGDISREENKAGRGMLSVVVVHKDGPNRGRPGNGFFILAQELGRDTRDRENFWISEFEKCANSGKPRPPTEAASGAALLTRTISRASSHAPGKR